MKLNGGRIGGAISSFLHCRVAVWFVVAIDATAVGTDLKCPARSEVSYICVALAEWVREALRQRSFATSLVLVHVSTSAAASGWRSSPRRRGALASVRRRRAASSGCSTHPTPRC